MKVGNYCGQRRPAWGGKVLRRDWGGLPAPRQRHGGRGSLFVPPPQTATMPPRKPHKPRKAAGGTATRGRAKSRVLRVLCASCASCGALAAGDEVEEAAPRKVRPLPPPPHSRLRPNSPCVSLRRDGRLWGIGLLSSACLVFPSFERQTYQPFQLVFPHWRGCKLRLHPPQFLEKLLGKTGKGVFVQFFRPVFRKTGKTGKTETYVSFHGG